jgi:hypothetical protein
MDQRDPIRSASAAHKVLLSLMRSVACIMMLGVKVNHFCFTKHHNQATHSQRNKPSTHLAPTRLAHHRPARHRLVHHRLVSRCRILSGPRSLGHVTFSRERRRNALASSRAQRITVEDSNANIQRHTTEATHLHHGPSITR